MDIQEIVRRLLEALARLLAILVPTRRVPATLIRVTPTSHLDAVDEEGRIHQETLHVDVQNLTGEPVRLERAVTLFGGTGGWLLDIVEHLPNRSAVSGALFTPPDPIGALATVVGDQTYHSWANTHVIHLVSASGPRRPMRWGRLEAEQPFHDVVAEAATLMDGATAWAGGRPASVTASPPAPASQPIAAGVPLHITLLGPLEVFDVTDTVADSTGALVPTDSRRLTVVGQIVALTAEAVPVQQVRLRLTAGAATLVDTSLQMLTGPEPGSSPPVSRTPTSGAFAAALAGDRPMAGRFYYSEPLPAAAAGFTSGTLRIDVRYALGGLPKLVNREEPVAFVRAPAILAPVRTPSSLPDSLWGWWNGPASPTIHGHTMAHQTRYTYDLGLMDQWTILKPGGDDTSREHYLAWEQEVLCVAAGEVHFIREDGADHNSGRDGLPANGPANVVVVRHTGADGRTYYSLYAHIKQWSATGAGLATTGAGATLAEGQTIGLIGNNGSTSSPHLHFSYYTFDPWGHITAIPTRFKNLHGRAGAPLNEVPRNAALCQAS